MPINVFQIYISIPCNKSIVVCFIHKLYYILKKIVVLCITLPCRRGSRPDGTRFNSIHYTQILVSYWALVILFRKKNKSSTQSFSIMAFFWCPLNAFYRTFSSEPEVQPNISYSILLV